MRPPALSLERSAILTHRTNSVANSNSQAMNKQIWKIVFLLTFRICDAQNLVPNGDFEQHSGCPTAFSQILLAVPWMNPSTNSDTTGSPDYYNQCAPNSTCNVPNNYLAYQPAHSGVAYSGFYLWQLNLDSVREYIEAPLTSTLIANSCYHFEMYVNLADSCQYTVDNISVYFSDTAITGINNYYPLPFNPQINNLAGSIFDTLSWMLVSGDYIAQGGENYLIIGNFNDDASTDTILVNSAVGEPFVYVFIDDVSLIQIPPCNTGIKEENEITINNIYPNPFNDKLTFRNINNELSEIILYDIASRKIIQEKFTNSVSLNTEQLAKGLYLYEVRSRSGLCKKGKVVKD